MKEPAIHYFVGYDAEIKVITACGDVSCCRRELKIYSTTNKSKVTCHNCRRTLVFRGK